MKWADFLLDKVTETDLFELAYTRKRVLDKCFHLSSTICEHFVKLTCFDNPADVRGHIKSLNGWFRDIKRLQIKGNKKLDSKYYYNEIWFNLVDSYDVLEEIFNDLKDDEYAEVPIRKVNFKNLYNKLCDVMNDIADDLEDRKFEGIEHYFDNRNVEYK